MDRENEILMKMDGLPTIKNVKAAMQELARERAIGFARFVDAWFKEPVQAGKKNYLTTEQLYDLYLSQLKEKL